MGKYSRLRIGQKMDARNNAVSGLNRGEEGNMVKWMKRGRMSDKFFELVNSQPRISDNPAHGEGIHGICARDGQNPLAIGHGDMFSCSNNPEPAFFKSFNGSLVVDPGKLRHERLLRTVLPFPRTASP